MGRDALGLAFDSLFIEKNRNAFKAANADLLTKVYDFSTEKSFGLGIESFQAAELLFNQDADAITIVDALLAHLVWQGQVEPSEISIYFDQTLNATLNVLSSSFILCVDTEYHRKDIHSYISISSPGKNTGDLTWFIAITKDNPSRLRSSLQIYDGNG